MNCIPSSGLEMRSFGNSAELDSELPRLNMARTRTGASRQLVEFAGKDVGEFGRKVARWFAFFFFLSWKRVE